MVGLSHHEYFFYNERFQSVGMEPEDIYPPGSYSLACALWDRKVWLADVLSLKCHYDTQGHEIYFGCAL